MEESIEEKGLTAAKADVTDKYMDEVFNNSKMNKKGVTNHTNSPNSSIYSHDENGSSVQGSSSDTLLDRLQTFSDVYTDNSDIEVISEERNTSTESIEVIQSQNGWNGDGLMRQNTVVEGSRESEVSSSQPTLDSESFSTLSVSSLSTLDPDARCSDSPRHDTWSPIRSRISSTEHTSGESPKLDSSTPEFSQQSSNTASPSTSPPQPAGGDNSRERPDSLSLPRPLQYYEKQRLIKKESLSSQSEFSSRSSSMDALIEQASNTPLHTQGSISKEGDMMTFVVDDLADMIKRSSPMSRSRTESSVSSWARSGGHSPSSMSSSTSGWDSSASSITGYSYSGISREETNQSTQARSSSMVTQSPDDIPLVDPRALMDLEVYATRTAQSLYKMSTTLNTNLHKMSGLTSGCSSAYLMGVDNTCDAVDSSIKSMYALMAKCEELSKTMLPLYGLKDDIKEIKRLLDLFEAQMNRDER